MFFHTCSAEELDNNDLSKKDLCSLLLTSLAEIHANQERFGGFDSISFKSKYKQIDRRGKKLCKKLFERPSENYGHCYIFVPNDLPKGQQVVQSSHVAIQIAQKFNLECHPSIVCIQVKNEKKIKSVIQELTNHRINTTIFRDIDLDHRITCVATEPLYDEKRKLLQRYCLLK